MATFTVTTAVNIDSLAGKTGGDTYNINGGYLTIDQDSRFGVNNSDIAALGNIVISSTLGGTVLIDARYVRYIPYNSGSGVVPNYNDVISQGSASGLLIGVYADIYGYQPIVPGNAMPASGYIKIKQWNSVAYTAGALTGISATSTGADYVAQIEISADEAKSITVPRLGQFLAKGLAFDVGTTSGSRATTYALPYNGPTIYCAALFIETAPSSGIYELFINGGSSNADAATFSTDWRSKIFWMSPYGVITIGNDGVGNTTGGYLPPSGCRIKVPNIFLTNATVANRQYNALPNATIATRYETATTSAGVIDLEWVNCDWYLNMAQPYRVRISDSGVFDNINISECATAVELTRVGVGQSAAVLIAGVTGSLNFAGGTVTDCVFSSRSLAASGRYVGTMTDISGFAFTRCKTISLTPTRGNSNTGAWLFTRADNCTFDGMTIGSGRMGFTSCTDLTITNTTYFDNCAGNTIATNGMYAFDMSLSCSRIMFDGYDHGGLYMTGPYNGILGVGSAGCTDITLRNVGTNASPLSMGSPRRDIQSWSRVTTTATVTSVAHGLAVGDTIYVVVSSVIAAIIVGAKTIATVPTADTFTFTCLNAGATSGTLSYFGTKTANVFVLGSAAAANGVRIQRVFAPHTRTNLYTADNSSKNITLENVFSDYLNIPLMVGLNMYNKNVSGTPTLAAQSSVYGTHWWNGYTCDVAQNTSGVSWTRSGTTVTVTAPDHRLRTTAATVGTNIPISVTVSSAEAPVPRGVYQFVTVIDADTFTIVGVNTGATSGTLSFRVGNGRIGVVMNEPTADTATHVTIDSGNPQFTSAGSLVMPTIGDQVTFTSPDYMLGQGSSFPIMELQILGSTLTRYNFAYALDKNDGAGFGAFHNLYYERTGASGTNGASTITMTDATGVEVDDYVWGTNVANKAQVVSIASNTITVDSPNIGTVSGTLRFNHLPSESSLGPDTGIKMKWRVTTKTANTVGITSLFIFSESTDLGRTYQYPLDQIPLTLTGLVTGSDVVVRAAGTSTILGQVDSNPTSNWTFVYETSVNVDIDVIKPGYVPVPLVRNYILPTTASSLPVSQLVDRNYA